MCIGTCEGKCKAIGNAKPLNFLSSAEQLWRLYEAMSLDDFTTPLFDNVDLPELSAVDFLYELERSIRLIHRSGEPFPIVRLMKEGNFVPKSEFCDEIFDAAGRMHEELSAAKIIQQFHNGATLNVNQCERISPNLHEIVGYLTKKSGKSVQINLYASKGYGAGFNPHFDSHDVIVYQAVGRKKWSMEANVRQNFAERSSSNSWDREITINHGCALIVPRGLWHSVCSIGEVSVHYTIGFHHDHHLPPKSEDIGLVRGLLG